MAIIAVNAPNERFLQQQAIQAALVPLEPGDTVTIMTHGFRYSPFTEHADPHPRLFSTQSRKASWKSVSWAHYLRLNRPHSGLGIGFGWPALGRFDQAAARAYAAGDAMAEMIAMIHAERPDLRLRLVAHSLGARVALRALARSPKASVDLALLLSGAEYRPIAAHALATPAGKTAHIVNVTSRENMAFDTLFRVLAPGRHMLSPTLSAGFDGANARWLDLKIDDKAHLDALRRLGYRPANPTLPICHWSSFIRPGLFPLYRRLLGADANHAFTTLARALRTPTSAERKSAHRALPQGRTA